MSDEASKRHASAWFSEHGFDVCPIPPVESAKRADLKATRDAEVYAVEAKGKGESSFWLNLLSAARERGMAHDNLRVRPSNTVSGVISEAYEQLEATPLGGTDFRVLWVLAAHEDGRFVVDAFETRLFGLKSLSCITLDAHGSPVLDVAPQVKECYFYKNSDFARFRNLDAAVLSTGGEGFLCVNPISPHVEAVRRSLLHQIFQKHGAIRDPKAEDEAGRALFVDAEIGPNGQREFLRQKYRLGTSEMIESRFSGLIHLDLTDPDN